MQKSITPQVGKKYRTRAGKVVELVASACPASAYPFFSNDAGGTTYTKEGRWSTSGIASEYDLVEEVQDNAHKHAELISMWAHDTTLKFQWLDSCSTWRDCVDGSPIWNPKTSYRVKPKVVTQVLYCQCKPSYIGERTDTKYALDNLKLTFIDGVLTQAEVV